MDDNFAVLNIYACRTLSIKCGWHTNVFSLISRKNTWVSEFLKPHTFFKKVFEIATISDSNSLIKGQEIYGLKLECKNLYLFGFLSIIKTKLFLNVTSSPWYRTLLAPFFNVHVTGSCEGRTKERQQEKTTRNLIPQQI